MDIPIDFKKIEDSLESILKLDILDKTSNKTLSLHDQTLLTTKLITAALKMYHKEIEKSLHQLQK